MNIDKLRTGERVAAVAAVILLVSMFLLTWFSVSVDEAASLSSEDAAAVGEAFTSVDLGGTTFGTNAWVSYGFIDLVLLVTIIVAIGLAALTASARTVSLPVAASALTTGLGILSVLLIVYSLIDTPFGFGVALGVFVGLLAAIGIAVGGWLAMRDEETPART